MFFDRLGAGFGLGIAITPLLAIICTVFAELELFVAFGFDGSTMPLIGVKIELLLVFWLEFFVILAKLYVILFVRSTELFVKLVILILVAKKVVMFELWGNLTKELI